MCFKIPIHYGAFTAGLKAGYFYNTFPLMNGTWIPPDLFALAPLWMNFLENGSTVQFLHRVIGLTLLLGVVAFRILAGRFSLNRMQRWGANLLVALLILQATLGALTLIYVVPVSLAVLHQAVAFVLFALALLLHYSFSAPARSTAG